ncbi:LPXTG cell wall anchor domain-containing protein [Streptococcus suis]|nr:LPXTG cell wall anchor domain-containing protein [Streptococcus suis]
MKKKGDLKGSQKVKKMKKLGKLGVVLASATILSGVIAPVGVNLVNNNSSVVYAQETEATIHIANYDDVNNVSLGNYDKVLAPGEVLVLTPPSIPGYTYVGDKYSYEVRYDELVGKYGGRMLIVNHYKPVQTPPASGGDTGSGTTQTPPPATGGDTGSGNTEIPPVTGENNDSSNNSNGADATSNTNTAIVDNPAENGQENNKQTDTNNSGATINKQDINPKSANTTTQSASQQSSTTENVSSDKKPKADTKELPKTNSTKSNILSLVGVGILGIMVFIKRYTKRHSK